MGTEAAMEHLKGHAANRLGSSAPNPSPPDVPQVLYAVYCRPLKCSSYYCRAKNITMLAFDYSS